MDNTEIVSLTALYSPDTVYGVKGLAGRRAHGEK